MNDQTAVMKSTLRNKPIDCGAVLLEQVPRLSAFPALIRQFLVFALQITLHEIMCLTHTKQKYPQKKLKKPIKLGFFYKKKTSL